MALLGLQEAAERTGTSKADVWRAIKEGSLAANRTGDGGFAIDERELFRIFEPKPTAAEPRAAADDCLARNSTPADAQPLEPARTNEIAVAFAALEAELKGLLAGGADPSPKH